MTERRIPLLALVPMLWLALFFVIPFAIIIKLSLSQVETAMPPYLPVFRSWDLQEIWAGLQAFSLANYSLLASDGLYRLAFATSLRIAALSTLLLLLIGYPLAYAIAMAPQRWRPLLVMAIILPFWTSFLIRVYALVGILKPEGLLNQTLLALGVIKTPLALMNTDTAIIIGIVYAYLPFMVLPLFATLERMDHSLVEAACDLGASPLRAFWRITLPLSRSGIIAGCLLCFIPILGEVVIPDLLGGTETVMIGKTLWTEFFSNRDWPMAASVAIVLLVLLLGPIMLFQHLEQRRQEHGA